MGIYKCKLGEVITQRREKSDGSPLPICGVSKDGLIPPKQIDADTSIYNTFYYKDFIFNPARMELNSIAFNDKYEKAICSSLYEVFFVHRTDLILPEYLKLIVKQKWFTRYCEFLGQGSAREYCRFANISEIEIDIPPMEIQEKAVYCDKVIAERINIKKQINNNLVAYIDAIFFEQFGEYKSLAESSTLNTDLSSLPVGWSIESASNFFDISIGKTPPRNELEWFTNNKSDNIWISIADMKTDSPYILDSTEYLTDEAVEKHSVKVVPANSVLLSFKMTVGRVAIVTDNVTTNEAIAHFPCTDKNIYFTYCYLKNFNYGYLGSTSSITTAINSKIIKNMPFLMPAEKDLEIFNNKVSAIFEQLIYITKEIAYLEELSRIIVPQFLENC